MRAMARDICMRAIHLDVRKNHGGAMENWM